MSRIELSEKAKAKLQELIRKYDPINNKSFKTNGHSGREQGARDTRLPIPGTVITREYKGKLIEVKVLEEEFEYDGKIYRSLTNIVKKITGSVWNGFNFFNL